MQYMSKAGGIVVAAVLSKRRFGAKSLKQSIDDLLHLPPKCVDRCITKMMHR